MENYVIATLKNGNMDGLNFWNEDLSLWTCLDDATIYPDIGELSDKDSFWMTYDEAVQSLISLLETIDEEDDYYDRDDEWDDEEDEDEDWDDDDEESDW